MVMIQVVFWAVMPCIDVVGYQHFSALCCLHLQSEESFFNLSSVCEWV